MSIAADCNPTASSERALLAKTTGVMVKKRHSILAVIGLLRSTTRAWLNESCVVTSVYRFMYMPFRDLLLRKKLDEKRDF